MKIVIYIAIGIFTVSTAIMMWCVLRSGDDDYEE